MNFYKKLNARRSGFTLIEMMVVVAIIGILAAIALPKLFEALCYSKVGKVNGNLTAIKSSMTMYMSKNQGNAANLDCVNLKDQAWFDPAYLSVPEPTWTGGEYMYSGSGTEFTISVALNGGLGCDKTAGSTPADDYVVYTGGSLEETNTNPCP